MNKQGRQKGRLVSHASVQSQLYVEFSVANAVVAMMHIASTSKLKAVTSLFITLTPQI